MRVIPKSGLQIPDLELGDVLPPDGRDVNDSDYWQRRLRDGDVHLGQGTVNQHQPANEVE